MKFIIWSLITIFIFLFVNQIYLNIKKSTIKEGLTNNDITQIKNNKNSLAEINTELINIKNLINKAKNTEKNLEYKFQENQNEIQNI